MAYFPFMVELADLRGLIVGAGSVAYEKAVRISEFGSKLRVVAPIVDERFSKLSNVEIARRPFEEDDIVGDLAFVIVATRDGELNRRIAGRCRDLRIPVNVVDSKEESSFIFPATTRRGDAVVAVSTGGAAPIVASAVKGMIDAILPDRLGTIVETLGSARKRIARIIKNVETRRRFYRSALQAAAFKRDAYYADFFERVVDQTSASPASLGRVVFVGAGSGSADLITLRGAFVLSTCDAVLYDDLIDRAILDIVPKNSLRIPVGKRGGASSTRQDDINRKMVELASCGMNVVRLKGGDPFLFARVEEEIRALKQNGVPFDVVPGVSSAFYIPMEAGVPLTCRDVSRSVHIVTAHASDSEVFEELPKFAKLEGTLGVMMGLNVVGKLAESLIAGGKSSDTPVAVLSGGNSANPYDVRGTLRDVADKCKRYQLKSPAVIVIGKVASLNLKSDFFDSHV